MNIEENYDKIYRFCYLRVKKRDVAEDLTQETFLKYLEHPQYHSTEKTLRILYTIAGNLCTDHFRKYVPDELAEEYSSEDDTEGEVFTKISLTQALEKLSQEDREIVLLRFVNETPIEVIGKLYNMSRFSVYRRIKRILSTLKNELESEELQ